MPNPPIKRYWLRPALIHTLGLAVKCMVTQASNVWRVPLGSGHTAYSYIQFKRGRASPKYVVVIVNTDRFIALYENNFDSIAPIPPATEWCVNLFAGIAAFLQPSNTQPEMPRVSFEVGL